MGIYILIGVVITGLRLMSEKIFYDTLSDLPAILAIILLLICFMIWPLTCISKALEMLNNIN